MLHQDLDTGRSTKCTGNCELIDASSKHVIQKWTRFPSRITGNEFNVHVCFCVLAYDVDYAITSLAFGTLFRTPFSAFVIIWALRKSGSIPQRVKNWTEQFSVVLIEAFTQDFR
ncbi:MAG: hypothetical protein JWM11_3677 [Planctomycetaceae bacterium]|nr:hypothetical protein [Planctomycetaceae bacterium]